MIFSYNILNPPPPNFPWPGGGKSTGAYSLVVSYHTEQTRVDFSFRNLHEFFYVNIKNYKYIRVLH